VAPTDEADVEVLAGLRSPIQLLLDGNYVGAPVVTSGLSASDARLRSAAAAPFAGADDTESAALEIARADLEARVESIRVRKRVTYEEARALWTDLDWHLRDTVASAVREGRVREALVGPPDEWGLEPFDVSFPRLLTAEIVQGVPPSRLAVMALARSGKWVPHFALLGAGGAGGVPNPAESDIWSLRTILRKLLAALGVTELLPYLQQAYELLTGQGLLSELWSAVKDWWNNSGEAARAAKKRIEKACEKIIKALKKAFSDSKLVQAIAKLAAKIGVPGWLVGVGLALLLDIAWNVVFG